MRRRGLAMLGAVLFALASCAGQPTVEAKPAMWRVSDGDTTIWLLGSIHLLPPNVHWRTLPIDQAIAEADTLILESSPDDRPDFDAFAKGEGLKPVAQRVSPGKRAVLDAMIERSGASRERLDGYDDWAVAVMLETGGARATGADDTNGVEAKLWQAFGQAGKTRLAFHRSKEQLSALDTLSTQLQGEMLENTLAGKSTFSEILRAWERGDTVSLEKQATCTPLDAKLVGQPNLLWSRWIAWRMRQPGKLLIAVGLGHMVGPYALPKLLQARGLKVERVQ